MRLPVRSPLPPFGGNGSTLAEPPARLSCQEPASRNGLSLARNDCPFTGPPFRGQRSRPAASMPCWTVFRAVRPFAPPLAAVSTPRTSGFNAQTRSLKPAQHSRLLLKSPLPVGAFIPLQIKAFNLIWCRASSPSEPARSPFAPRNRF